MGRQHIYFVGKKFKSLNQNSKYGNEKKKIYLKTS